jgi:hypothetical protein
MKTMTLILNARRDDLAEHVRDNSAPLSLITAIHLPIANNHLSITYEKMLQTQPNNGHLPPISGNGLIASS